jgi:hypothetical protein
VIEALKSEGRVTEIPSGRSVEEVWEDVKRIVERVIAAQSGKEEQQMQEQSEHAEEVIAATG